MNIKALAKALTFEPDGIIARAILTVIGFGLSAYVVVCTAGLVIMSGKYVVSLFDGPDLLWVSSILGVFAIVCIIRGIEVLVSRYNHFKNEDSC